MRTISGSTKLLGVLGNPVRHSLSPVIHNSALAEMGLDWCYLAMPCEPKNLEITIKALRNMNCKGLNITIPLKEKALPLCKQISSISKKISAVNTLIPNESEGWKGDNTDVAGFLAPLKNINLENKNAILLGCGGSARAVFLGLEILNIKTITVVGRNADKLNSFIKEMSININPKKLSPQVKGILEKDLNLIDYIKTSDLIINATPIGMTSNKSEIKMPLGHEIWTHLEKGTTLYDLIYTPRPTKWLENGLNMNCNVIDGLEMLIQQGAASLRLWSNFEEIPIKLMRESALNHLNS
tara:strand:- start:1017 stop:1907 length:891 start_codon:yes stop_codon:yes gene_type:complete